MKKWLISMLLVLAMAVPVFAQDSDVVPGKLQLGVETLIPIEYKKINAFQGFTSDSPQFYTQYPESAVFAGNNLYAHIQWEFKYPGLVVVPRIYTLKVTGPNGYSYTDSVQYDTFPGTMGEFWQAFYLPTYEMASGYYKFTIKVSVKGCGSKTVKSTFRIY